MSRLDYKLKSLFFKLKSSQHIIRPPKCLLLKTKHTHTGLTWKKFLLPTDPSRSYCILEVRHYFSRQHPPGCSWSPWRPPRGEKQCESHGSFMGSGITKADCSLLRWGATQRNSPEEQHDSDPGAIFNFDFTTDWLRRFCKSLNSLWCSCLI